MTYSWIGYLHRTWIWNLFSCVTPGSAGCDVRQKSVLRSSVAFRWRVSVWTTVYNVVLRSFNDSMMRGNCRPSTNSSSSRNHWMRAGGRPSREMHVAWNGWSISNALCIGWVLICKSGRRGATEWVKNWIYCEMGVNIEYIYVYRLAGRLPAKWIKQCHLHATTKSISPFSCLRSMPKKHFTLPWLVDLTWFL